MTTNDIDDDRPGVRFVMVDGKPTPIDFDALIADAKRIKESEAAYQEFAKAKAMQDAAPDMLAALEAVAESNSYWWQEVGMDVHDMVHAAIAKAKGVAP